MSKASLQVLASTGQKAVLPHLVPRFEQAGGCTVAVTYGSADAAMARIGRGESADMYIGNAAVMDELVKRQKILPGSRRELARGSIGVAVRSGAPRPDIGSAEAFRRAMLEAKSIAYASIGASGVHFARLAEQLGIASQVQAKALTEPDGLIGHLVVEGKADLVVQHLSELKAVSGLDIVGPLPPGLQKEIIINIGIAADTRQKEGAQALLDFLVGPQATPVFEANGYSRGQGRA